MKRRSFFSLLAGAAGIPLLPKTPNTAYIVSVDPGYREGDNMCAFVFDPVKYMGEVRWVNIVTPKPA